MTKDGAPDILCWDCIKARHVLCTGKIPDTDSDKENHGKNCECPVCHGNRHSSRRPEYDSANACYYDPGLMAEPRYWENEYHG